VPLDRVWIGVAYGARTRNLRSHNPKVTVTRVVLVLAGSQDGMLPTIKHHLRVELGWSDVPVTILDFHDLLVAQSDENVQRLDFAPSEAVAIAKALRSIEAAEAKDRRREHAKTAPDTSAESAEVKGKKPSKSEGESRKRVADAVGMGRTALAQATEVVEAATTDPSLASIVEQMDATGNVSAAHRKMLKAQEEKDLAAASAARQKAIGEERRAVEETARRRTVWAKAMVSLRNVTDLSPAE
jgi:hypothetical protein